MFDYLIVGSGFFGATLADQLTKYGKSVLVIDQRSHIGGNCYSEIDQTTNAIIHNYGPHIFHTNDLEVWKYICSFTPFNNYRHRAVAERSGKRHPMPISLYTFNSFYNTLWEPKDVIELIESKRSEWERADNFEDYLTAKIGYPLYEALFQHYSAKLWGCSPRLIPVSVAKRIPIYSTYNVDYHNHLYSGMPLEGYTPIFEQMLKNATVQLGVDFFDNRSYWEGQAHHIIYSGPIDRWFDYSHGKLQWRSMQFDIKTIDEEDFQGVGIVHYGDPDNYLTRTTEFKQFHPERSHHKTVVCFESPMKEQGKKLDYPVNTPKDKSIFGLYLKEAAKDNRLTIGGRLGRYAYINMDDTIRQALDAARELLQPR